MKSDRLWKQELFWGRGDKNVLKLDYNYSSVCKTLYKYTKKSLNCTFKWVNFMLCDLFINTDLIFIKMFSLFWLSLQP